eukprot:TRINITY_DN10646_c0_g1_i1.p1 TRINITY_DN10646_c0_g1~~TRINITY_DN10646_c0_g1_i1.p1  ORF type:complete len:494 (+),score=123.38 TRINITY_DN10646_c0_g1_i1:12-1493(+)
MWQPFHNQPQYAPYGYASTWAPQRSFVQSSAPLPFPQQWGNQPSYQIQPQQSMISTRFASPSFVVQPTSASAPIQPAQTQFSVSAGKFTPEERASVQQQIEANAAVSQRSINPSNFQRSVEAPVQSQKYAPEVMESVLQQISTNASKGLRGSTSIAVPVTARSIILDEYLGNSAPLTSDIFATVSTPLASLKPNEVLLQLNYASVDPYMIGRCRNVKSYSPPFQRGQPIVGGGVATVIQSTLKGVEAGAVYSGSFPWSEFFILNETTIAPAKKLPEGTDPEAAMGVCGLVGLTAYAGLFEIGKISELKPGATIFVSAAAGGTGLAAVQIAKIKGFHVVGCAGSADKLELLKSLGIEAFNYKSPSWKEEMTALCPRGIDLYFDNTGGEIADHALSLMNVFGVIVVCGAISEYSGTPVLGPRRERALIVKQLRMQGFLVSTFMSKWGDHSRQLLAWLKEGKLQNFITLRNGFDEIVPALLALFSGENTGKMLVKI